MYFFGRVNETDLNAFYAEINEIHTNLKFSKELQQNNCLSYLDVLLKKNNNFIESTVYRKPTHTGLYTKWTSLCPLKYKRNLVYCLLYRAYRICNTQGNLDNEIKIITNFLLKNGYPLRFINSQIRRLFKTKQKLDCTSPTNSSTTKIKPHRIFLRLPFIGHHSTHLEKELKTFYHRHLSDMVNLNVIHKTFSIGDLFRHKENQPLMYRNNVVYKLTCSCGSTYIGQTRRNLQLRMNEHNPKFKHTQETDVTKHLLENPGHTINFDQPQILTSACNTKELLIKETILIQQEKPDINVDLTSIPLYIFNN